MKSVVSLWMGYLILVSGTSKGESGLDSDDNFSSLDTNKYLDAAQVISKYQYPSEAHTIQTKDGYLLEMHRIPYGRDLSEHEKRPPVLIQHGLLSCSMHFLLLGPENSLAFLLANLGFDVWLGNVRGNTYSRAHVSLETNDRRFWNFTWHDSAVHDLTAQIDFILNYTKSDKLAYMGHSMGTTMFFALMSTIPEYNEKISISMLMAPVAYLSECRSPIIKIFAPVSGIFEFISRYTTNGELMPESNLMKTLGSLFCESHKLQIKICLDFVYLLLGDDPAEIDKKNMEILIYHFPSGYSMKAVNHYAQIYNSGYFRQYDYGESGNLVEYGSATPPSYNLENIKAPMYFYSGKADYLSTIPDVMVLSEKLISLQKMYVVPYDKFNHLDFLISSHAVENVYNEILKDLCTNLENSPPGCQKVYYKKGEKDRLQ